MLAQDYRHKLDLANERGGCTAVIAECDHLLARRVTSHAKAFLLRQKGLYLARASDDNLHLAIAAFREALSAATGHPDEEGKVLANLVAACAVNGSCHRAHEYLSRLEALVASHSTADLRTAYHKALFNVGYAHDWAEHLEEAVAIYTRVLEETEDPWLLGWSATNLTSVYLRLNRIADAGHVLQIAKGYSQTVAEAALLESESSYLLAIGSTADAEVKALEALAHPSCDVRLRGQLLLTSARIALAKGDGLAARRLADEALTIGESIPCALVIDRAVKFLQSLAAEGVS